MLDISLFKMDFESHSIIYFWRGWVEDIGHGWFTANYEYGRLNGKYTRPKPKRFSPFSGKQGRDAKGQAEFTVMSKANKKRDHTGYWDTLAEATQNPTFLPMLANKFKKQKGKLTNLYPVNGQRKFDGVRCIAQIEDDGSVSLISRSNTPFHHLDHIRKAIAKLKNVPDDFRFDGELYADPKDIGFQEATGLIGRETLKFGDKDKQKFIKYRLYDSYNPHNVEKGYFDRHKELEQILTTAPSDSLILTENFSIPKEEDVAKLHSQFIQEGYEGLMVRTDSPYRVDKRAFQLLKYKDFDDAEFEVIDYKEGQGDDVGTVVWRCITERGEPFWVRPRGTRATRAKWFQNGDKHIGSDLTVRYFGLTDDKKPRFPVGIAIRDYE